MGDAADPGDLAGASRTCRRVARWPRSIAALALLVADLLALLRAAPIDDAAWEAHARSHRRTVREAIESARTVVLDTLRTRGAASHRATQSLIRLEAADQIFGALIALTELLEHADAAERATAMRLLRRLRPLLIVLGRAIVTDDPAAPPRIGRAVDALVADRAALPAEDALRGIVDRIVERLRVAQTLAVPANFAPGTDAVGRRAPIGARVRAGLIQPVLANLDWRSPALRLALRAALVAAPALAFTMLWFTPYDHWLTITIVATMQPYFALTYARAIERVVGTLLGGLVAALVGLVCTTPLSIAAAMFPLAVAALAVRAVGLGLFLTALTPLIVLLVEIGAPDTSEWLIAATRAGFTLIGGVLAVAALLRAVAEPREGASGRGSVRRDRRARALRRSGPGAPAGGRPGRHGGGDAARGRRHQQQPGGRHQPRPERARHRRVGAAGIGAGDRRRAAPAGGTAVGDAARPRPGAGRGTDGSLDGGIGGSPGRLARLDRRLDAGAGGGQAIAAAPPRASRRDAVARIARQIELMAGALARHAMLG